MENQNHDFDPFRDMKVFVGGALLIFAITSRTIEVFLRRNFGVRYLKFELIVATFVGLNIASVLMGEENRVTGMVTISSGIRWFSLAFLALGFYHLYKNTKRHFDRNFSIHSQTYGDSWNIWNRLLPEEGFLNRLLPGAVQRFAEPGLVFIIASIAAGFDPALGAFLAFAATSLLISMQIQYRMQSTRFLDAMDAKIEAEGGSPRKFGKKDITPSKASAEKKIPQKQDWEK